MELFAIIEILDSSRIFFQCEWCGDAYQAKGLEDQNLLQEMRNHQSTVTIWRIAKANVLT